MWLILLLLQLEVKTQRDAIQFVPEPYEKGPNYNERIQLLGYNKHNSPGMWLNHLQTRTNDFLIDSTIFFSPAIEHQALPQATFDGTNYFVIWADDRRTTPTDNKRDIYGTRVSIDGQILDPNGIFIGATQSGGNVYIGTFPAVAYGDGVYLCVYEDFDWASYTWDLWGVRVDTAGIVLDPNRIQITNRYTSEGMAQVAFDGTNFLVVWQDYNGSIPDKDVYGARVTPQGVVLDPNGFPILASPNYNSKYVDVAFDGTNYMVVWTDERTPSWSIYFARVTPQAVVLDPAGYPICDLEQANANMPRITYGSGNYFVVWDDCRDPHGPPYGARVTPQGVVLDPDGFRLAPTSLYYFVFPSVTFDGINYFVTMADHDLGCYGVRVTPSGIVIDTNCITIETPYPAYTTDVISNGSHSFVVWSMCNNIYGARISQSGNVLDPNGFLVSTSVNVQEMSAVSYDTQRYFVVWEDSRNTWNICGKFVSPETGPVGSTFPISTRNWTEDWPGVAFGDTNYLVVWNGNFSTWDVFGARVSTTGQVLDPGGIAIGAWSGDQGYPSVAYGNGNWLVVWDDSRNDAGDIYGARINSQGQNLDPLHIAISTANNSQWYPSVSFDGTNYIVVWADSRNGNFDIYCARLDTAGNVLDPGGIVISNADIHQSLPKVIFDGNNYFIVWMDWRNYGTTEWDIFGARVTPQGVVLDPGGIPICTAPYDQGYPSVAYDGEDYIVLWEDYRSQETCDIYGARITTNGVVLDTFIVSDERVNEIYPSLAKGQFPHALFTYAKQAPEPYEVFRVYGQYYPPVGIEELRAKSQEARYKLEVYPNPFSNFTQINYSLPHPANVSLKLYSADGRLVATLLNETKKSGNYSLKYDFRNLNQGIYFLYLKAGSLHKTTKLIKGL